MKTILCISGGVDSIIAWFYLGKPQAVYFDLGTKYTAKEIKCLDNLKKIIPDFDYTKDDSLKSFGILEIGENAFIPYRNLLFATACAANYKADIIVMGGIKGDNVCDKSPKAFEEMSRCLTKVGEKPIKVMSPFWKKDKASIIRGLIKNEPNAINILKTSVSCYSDTPGSCGNCKSCSRKWVALEYVGIDTDNWFEKDPFYSPQIKEYEESMLNDTGNEHYDSSRKNQFAMVIRKEYIKYWNKRINKTVTKK